jgi:iron complex transport system ATP-binding protein
MLRAESLTAAVPGRLLCQALTLELGAGECWCVLGANGAGKSTLVAILAGLRAAREGDVTLAGQPLDAWRRRELARRLGVLPQDEPALFWGTVEEYVALGRHPYQSGLARPSGEDRRALAEALRAVDMDWARTRAMATLSGGERQRARLAALFAQEPAVYLLDEPLQHLDLAHQRGVLAYLRALAHTGGAVLAVVHETAWSLGYFTHALLLYGDGRWQAGPLDEVATEERLAALYGCPMAAVAARGARGFVPCV